MHAANRVVNEEPDPAHARPEISMGNEKGKLSFFGSEIAN